MGIFFKDRPKEEPELVEQKQKPVIVKPTPAFNTETVDGSNNDYVKHLDEEIRKKISVAPSYVTFADTLHDLDSQPLDEKTKYVVNFATYQRMGLSVDKLISDAGLAIAVLDREKIDFEQAVATSRALRIDQKNAEIEAEKHAIEDLTAEIKKKQERIQACTMAITDDTLKINTKEMSFNTAYLMKKDLIVNHISKIKMYLNATTTK